MVDLTAIERSNRLDAYVPSIATNWISTTPNTTWRGIEGTVVFADISGFTALSERLAQQGRIGAEELTTVLDRVFGAMLEVVYERGGSLLKFGGDALLLLFTTDDHAIQACAAALEMRSALKEACAPTSSAGRIRLRMSSGIHSGQVDLFLVGDSHRELIITGPAASVTTGMEGTASAGEIVVSDQTRALLPKGFTGNGKGAGWLLAKRVIHHPRIGRIRPGTPSDDLVSTLIPTALRRQLATGVGDSEHRIATVGFLKFNGVDRLLASAGPDRVGAELEGLMRVVQTAADAEGVCFLASDIDADGAKIILATGVPSSQHDDEGRMLRTARRILDSDLALGMRMGVNRGHVFSGDVGTPFRRTYTVMGDAVNLAARVMTAAPLGMLYATASVLDRSATLFRAEALPPFRVKGKQQPIQAYSVTEDIGVRPPELEDDLPFHGREAELERIVGTVNSCSWSGTGGMTTISGATGAGKSRLIAEALKRCPGMDTMIIQAEPNGSENPYWAFRDPIRRLLGIVRSPQSQMIEELEKEIEARTPHLLSSMPLLGEVMHITVPDNEVTSAIDPRFRPDRTADAVIELLAGCCPRPLAIVAEDGQWLDAASLLLLRRLGGAASTRPWTVIVTARREVHGHEVLGDELILRRLDDDTIREIAMVATAAAPLRPHELDAVVGKADGNPLVLSELLRVIRDTGSAEQLPESIGALVATQIDTLHPLTRQVLRYASVLGRSFPQIVLEEFLAPEHVYLDDATRRELSGFIDSDGADRLRFRHSVVHEAAYEGLSYRKRRELHARAGEVIERLAGDDLDSNAEALAIHYSQAGMYEETWHYARVAADRARHAYANTEAAAQYRRAIVAARELDEVSGAVVAELWSQLGEVLELAGQLEAARGAYNRALKEHSTNGARVVELYLRRARAWMVSGNLSQAKRNVTLGRNRLAVDDAHTRLRLLARLDAFESSIYAARGDPIHAMSSSMSAINHARELGERDEALARAYQILDWANFVLGRDEPRRGPEAIEIYEELGQIERTVGIINNLGIMSYLAGDWAAAIEWYERSSAAAERSGNVAEAALARANLAEVLIAQRRFDESLRLIQQAETTYRASNASYYLPFVGLLRSRAEVGLGSVDSAVERLSSLFISQVEGERTSWTVETGVVLADALIRVGRPDEALTTLALLENEFAGGINDHVAAIRRVRADALAEKGDLNSAFEAWDEALETALDDNDLYQESLIRETRAEWRHRAGYDPDLADATRLDDLVAGLGIMVPSPAWTS